jgi:hypothetical protein
MKPVFVAAAASLLAATPATAITYDLYDSFNGTASPGNFKLFEVRTNPAIPYALTKLETCLSSFQCVLSANYDVLGFYKNPSDAPAGIYPAHGVHWHPGRYFDAVAVFVAPTTGSYRINSAFSLLDNTVTGVRISRYKYSTAARLTKLSSLDLTAAKRSETTMNTIYLRAGEGAGVGINRGGTDINAYYFDSTSLAFRVTAVPEPATWALLIAGFGLTGAVLRRRRAMPAAA